MTFILMLVLGAAMWIVGDGPDMDRVALAEARANAQREEAGFVTRTNSDVLSLTPGEDAQADPEREVTTAEPVAEPATEADEIADQLAANLANQPIEPPEVQPTDTRLAEPDETIVLYVTGRRVNLRAGPSTNDTVLGRVSRGDAVELVDYEENGWARIRVAGLSADVFMSGDFLSDSR
ncbi:SH3 domain-containing protein [Actibacterium sp. 188UL27-1]|nr:SH3 domain-containing protein [Actibacterium sp. 188UL27-1]